MISYYFSLVCSFRIFDVRVVMQTTLPLESMSIIDTFTECCQKDPMHLPQKSTNKIPIVSAPAYGYIGHGKVQ